MVDLIIVCPHLGDGGVQRVTSVLANAWSRDGRKVVVVTLYREPACYTLDPEVRVISVLDHAHSSPLLRAIEWLRIGGGFGARILSRAASSIAGIATSVLGLLSHWMEWEASDEEHWLVTEARRVAARLRGTMRTLSPVHGLERLFERLPANHPLTGLWRLHLPALLRVRALRHVFDELRPGAVIGLCGSTNVVTALAGEGLPQPVIISERNDPERQRLEAPWNGLRAHFYRKADIVTANTHGALDAMGAYVDASKLHFVPNPVVRAPARARSSNAPCVLTVGRLHPQKAQDVLLRAFAALRPEFASMRLSIVGQGRREDELRQLADELGIEPRIDWHGQVANPFSHYVPAEIFALPSLHEGTPNALLEAMSCAMAVIVSDGSPGPLELVQDGVTGLVVPAGDPAPLARAIERLAADPDLRASLGRAAKERVREYDLPRALETWEDLLGWKPENPGTPADATLGVTLNSAPTGIAQRPE